MNRNLALKRMIGRAAGLLPGAGRRRVVLLYHSVGETPWALPEPEFRAQVAWLADNTALVTVDELLADARPEPLQVAVTFDDGYGSLTDICTPILRDAGTRPCVYLNTGWIQPKRRRPSDAALGHYPDDAFLTWPEVHTLAEAGWTIGSHGVEHLDLTRQPDAVARYELAESKSRIESELGGDCTHFAYTWGRSIPRLREMVREAGYGDAMGGQHGPVTAASDPMAIPRINVATDYSLDDFKAIVRGDWDYLGAIQAFRAARAG